MKRILLSLSFAFTFLLIAQSLSSADILDDVGAGLRAGSSSSLAKLFDASIDITILDKESVYSKAQGELVIKNFFQKNPVKSFSILHRGKSPEGSLWGIGNLSTTSRNFRVYYLVKSLKGAYLLEELKFVSTE